MSNKFTRNITGTKLKGEKIEPFDTNVQNDLLSDETDVYVRQERSKDIEDKYHCLTDDVKEIISNSDLVTTENFEHGESEQEDKNKSYINVNKSNKTESEKMESNSHVMTPLQTGYSIEKNNRDVIPNLVKQHETPTEIVSKSNDLKVKKISKNNFELELEINSSENGEIEISSDNEVINIEKVDKTRFNISIDSGKFYTVGNPSTLTLDSNDEEELIDVIGRDSLSYANMNNIVNKNGTPAPSFSYIRKLITLEEFRHVTGKLAKRIIELEKQLN